jgi:hypothetical protein
MANTQTLGIAVEVQDKGASKLLMSINANLEKMAEKGKKAPTETNQAVANLVDGLRFVQQGIQSVVSAVDNFAVRTTAAFVEAETAMTDINIVIGRTGKMLDGIGLQEKDRAAFASLGKEYKAIEGIVGDLARTTEFSYSEIAILFKQLKQSGLSVEAITKRIKDGQGTASKSILESTLALTSASRGALTLSDAAKTLVLSSNSLGNGLSGVADNADRMIRMVNNADVAFEDLKIMMESMAGAGKNAFETTKAEEMITVMAALKTQGQSAAQAGNSIVGLGRAINNLMGTFIKADEYKKNSEGFFASTTGKKKQPRKTVKAFALARLGLTKEAFVGEDGKLRNILAIIRSIREASSRVQKDATAYKALTGKSLKGAKLGQADAMALVYKALGTQQATQIVKATEILEGRLKQTGSSIKTMEEFAAMIADIDNDALRAQQTALSDNRGATKLLESAVFSLMQRMGEVTGGFDTFSKRATKNYVNAMDEMMRESDSLTDFVGSLTIGLKILGKVAVATAGLLLGMFGIMQVSIGLSAAVAAAAETGVVVTGMMGALKFHLAKLIPFIAPLATVILLVLSLSLVFSRLKQQGDDAFGWIGKSISGAGKSIDAFIKYYIPVLMGKNILDSSFAKEVAKDLNKDQKQTLIALAKFSNGMSDVMGGMLDGIATTVDAIMSFVLTPIKWLIDALGWVIDQFNEWGLTSQYTAKDLKKLKKELSTQNDALVRTGKILGGVIGAWLSYKLIIIAWTGVVKTATAIKWAWNVATSWSTYRLKIQAFWLGVTNKATKIATLWTTGLAWATAFLAGTYLGLFLVIGALIGVIMYLWHWHQELMKNQEQNYWIIMGLRVAMLVFAVALVGALFLLGKMIIAGFGLQVAFWPVVLTIAAVVAVVALLGYGIYKLLSWMGLLGENADGVGDKFTGMGDKVKEITGGAVVPKDAPADVVTATAAAGIPQKGKKAVKKGVATPVTKESLEAELAATGVNLPKGTKVPNMQELASGLPNTKGMPKTGGGSMGTSITININHKTNVDQLDTKTAIRVSKQLGPLIVKQIEQAMT